MVDARARRCAFLGEAIVALGLDARVDVVEARAEVVGRDPGHRGGYDLVVARGFGPPAAVAECAAPLLRLDDSYASRIRVNSGLRIFDAASFEVLGRSDHVRPHGKDRRCAGDGDRCDDLADVHRMPDDNRVALDFEREDVGDYACSQTSSNARGKITALSRRAEHGSAIAA